MVFHIIALIAYIISNTILNKLLIEGQWKMDPAGSQHFFTCYWDIERFKEYK
jgi:hypothetical protein